ncbi:hypothetical protein [Leptospira levettii]|uniref:Lipoprotein n=1 Tax=Leptospira levettii TaxID=2023178 RepID=A0ABY2MLS6_9LEPT|nr:hypothetical protein [Leptospira levettii]TGL68897.1 hypothetical protein EHQ60_13625 [Leptospira levettii]
MKKSLLFLLIAVAFIANCSTTTKTMPGLYTSPVELAPADYTISGETTGKSCGGRFLIFPYGFTYKFGVTAGMFADYIESQAIYDAISKVENANYLVNPKFEYETTTYLFFASSTCVTVKAKAITLKTGPVK